MGNFGELVHVCDLLAETCRKNLRNLNGKEMN